MRVSRRRPRSTPTPDAHVDADSIREAIAELLLGAMGCMSPLRMAGVVQELLASPDPGSLPPDRQAAEALLMATMLSLFTPSFSGSTAVDRFARKRDALSPAATAAVTTLRQARFRLLRIEHAGSETARLQDIASGECIEVGGRAIPPGFTGLHLVAWLAPLPDGTQALVSSLTPFDEGGLAVAMTFIRPGRRDLSNPLRCAEAVFRHALQNGPLIIPGLNAALPGEEDEADDEVVDLHALALRWAQADAPRDPDDVQFLRGQADLAMIVAMLASVVATREHGLPELADGYAAIAQIQLDTVQRRAAAGSGALRLPAIEEAVRTGIAEGDLPPGTRAVLSELRLRLGAPAGETGRAGKDAELDKLVGRIQALRAKTVEQGCTEQEALAAAQKVAELLDRYGLTLNEFDLRQQTCEGVAVETGRRRAGPLDHCVPAAAAFFDCRVWSEKAPGGTLRYVFFGLPADVAAARYMYDLIDRAFDSETAAFKAGATYEDLSSKERRTATNSFQIGLGRGITAKLDTLRKARDTARPSSGRDLLVVKAGLVEEELASLGLNLRMRSRSGGRRVFKDAFDQGHTAGFGFTYTPGVGQDAAD